jgi:16S rRNA (guanine1207-N2)-methyltransferase
VLCGALAARHPALELVALDVDSLALEAVAINVPRAVRVLSDGWPAELGEPFRLILSNPPIHRGKTESMQIVERLIDGAPKHLDPKGELRVVVQRRLAVDRLLSRHFRDVDVVADDGPWRVWSARRRYLRRTRDRGGSESRR